MVGVVGRQGSGGSGVGPVLSGSGLVGLAVVILGSQVTLGAAQGEMAEAALGAVADIFEGQWPEFQPLENLRAGLRSCVSPSLVLEWLGKIGTWWLRSEPGGHGSPASDSDSSPQWQDLGDADTSPMISTPERESVSLGSSFLSFCGIPQWSLILILCVVGWITLRWVSRSASLVTVNVYTSASKAWCLVKTCF